MIQILPKTLKFFFGGKFSQLGKKKTEATKCTKDFFWKK
jgi:hypothetical protein